MARDPATGITTSFAIQSGITLKTTPGFVVSIRTVVGGSGIGGVYDTNAVGSISVKNQLVSIPATGDLGAINLPFVMGLTVVPGTGQILTVAWV